MFWRGRRKANIWVLIFFEIKPPIIVLSFKIVFIKINWNKTPNCYFEEEEHNDVEHDDENTICIKCTVSWY